MNKNEFILTTAGLIIPNNEYYNPVKLNEVNDATILDRALVNTTNKNLSDFVKSYNIYHSDLINDAYKVYEGEKTFENFINLVSIASDILSKINFNTFFEIQASNKNISNTMFMLCVDIYNGKFINNYLQYAVLPLNSRFTVNNNFSTEVIRENVLRLNRNVNTGITSWNELITTLADNEPAFVSFFRLFFTDPY